MKFAYGILATWFLFSLCNGVEFEPLPPGADTKPVDLGVKTIQQTFARAVDTKSLLRASNVVIPLPNAGKIDIPLQYDSLPSDKPFPPSSFSSGGYKDVDMVLTSKDDITVGTINTVNGTYIIRPAPNAPGIVVIGQVDSESLPPEGHPSNTILPPSYDQAFDTLPIIDNPTADKHSIVDVLLLYTNKSKRLAGSAKAIELVIQNAIDWTNSAYANSKIVHRVRTAAIKQIPYDETKDMSRDLDFLRRDQRVQKLREDHGADLIALVRDNTAGYCGLGYVLMNPKGQSNLCVSTAAYQCLPSTLAHEMGHNMGSVHDEASSQGKEGITPYSFGYRHCIDNGFRTVMGYACRGGYNRIPYFSNPAVSYRGLVTGTPTANNFRSLTTYMQVVAQYRKAVPNNRTNAPTPDPGGYAYQIGQSLLVNLLCATLVGGVFMK
eukprot:Platyproteum_vivax@DN7589_c0_g1_i1.p1